MKSNKGIVIGRRGSKLALLQAEPMRARLAHREIDLLKVTLAGDSDKQAAFGDLGGDGIEGQSPEAISRVNMDGEAVPYLYNDQAEHRPLHRRYQRLETTSPWQNQRAHNGKRQESHHDRETCPMICIVEDSRPKEGINGR